MDANILDAVFSFLSLIAILFVGYHLNERVKSLKTQVAAQEGMIRNYEGYIDKISWQKLEEAYEKAIIPLRKQEWLDKFKEAYDEFENEHKHQQQRKELIYWVGEFLKVGERASPGYAKRVVTKHLPSCERLYQEILDNNQPHTGDPQSNGV